MNPTQNEFARKAVALGLLKFPATGQTFPGRRGGPGKPYLVDSRGAGANPRLRAAVVSALRVRLDELADVQAVAGLARSGMTWAAWLAQETGLPYATVLLDGPRDAGLQREVEGDIRGCRTVLVDNWVSSGASLIQAAEIICRHGAQVAGAIAIAGRVTNLGFPVGLAFDVSTLLREAAHQQLISLQLVADIQTQ